MPVIVSMFQLKLFIKKLTTFESQHQHIHDTVMVSFGLNEDAAVFVISL